MKIKDLNYILGLMKKLFSSWIDTKCGKMLAIASIDFLYLLEFEGRKGLNREIQKLERDFQIEEGVSEPISKIQRELKLYFDGKLHSFKTPVKIDGTAFQKEVWKELMKIPYAKKISYRELAEKMGRPKAFRAVANANGKNQLAIIIPCHRVINSNGEIGGYGGGISKKRWLLDHERK